MKNTNSQKLIMIDKYLFLLFRDREIPFWIISLLHYNFSLIIILFIYLFHPTDFYFKIGVCFFFISVILNVILKQHFLLRLEKYLLREKSWNGIYELLPYFKINKNKENIELINHYVYLTTFYLIILKIYF
jgi:hypothetical protein